MCPHTTRRGFYWGRKTIEGGNTYTLPKLLREEYLSYSTYNTPQTTSTDTPFHDCRSRLSVVLGLGTSVGTSLSNLRFGRPGPDPFSRLPLPTLNLPVSGLGYLWLWNYDRGTLWDLILVGGSVWDVSKDRVYLALLFTNNSPIQTLIRQYIVVYCLCVHGGSVTKWIL